MTLIRWEDHPAQVMEGITELYKISEFTDCVLDVEEGSIHGHKIILAACSPYLKKLLMDHQGMTMIPFKEVKYKDMKLILDFMYLGEVDVPLVDVTSLMDTAELLQISSLRCATHHFAEESATADVCTNEKRAIPNKDLHSGRKDRFDSIGRNIEVISVKGSKRKAIYVLKQLPEKANEDQPNVSVFETDVIGSDHVNNIRDESLSITFVAVPSEPEERGEEEQNKGGEVCVHSADQSVSYDARDGTVPDGADGLEVQYKSISVISVPDLEAGNWIDTSVVVEDTKVSRESSSLGGEGEISNCESQETYLIHYEPAATEGLGDDANVSHLEPKEAIVLLETADPDGHQMEVSHDTGVTVETNSTVEFLHRGL